MYIFKNNLNSKLMKTALLVLFTLGLGLGSCKHRGSGNCSETNISTVSRSSHHFGNDCARCHTSGNSGNGCFTVAGTALDTNKYSPLHNAVIVLFSRDDNGVITGVSNPIKCDKSGNFYTTESISFAGKYPAIIHNGDTSFMSSPLTNTASCNKCHSKNAVSDTNGITATQPIYLRTNFN